MEEDEGDAADHVKMESFTIMGMQEDYLMVNNNRTGPAPAYQTRPTVKMTGSQ
jgi:hypothetical protein